MHEIVFYFAVIWVTALLVVSVIMVMTMRAPASRVLALDMMGVLLVALLVLYATWRQSPYYLDAALALALLSFTSTIIFSRYRAEDRVF